MGEIIRFGVAAAFLAPLSIFVPLVLHGILKVPEKQAIALSLVVLFAVNFFVDRNYVFRSNGTVLWQAGKHALASGVFRVSEFTLFLVLFDLLSLHYILSLVGVLCISLGIKYFVQRFIIFSR